MNIIAALAFSAGALLSAQEQDLNQAAALYQHTDYNGALRLLRRVQTPDAEAYSLMGKCTLMQGDSKQATEYFQKAAALAPGHADYVLWLGRSWGRRAETASPFLAPVYATHARDDFEKALTLDPGNRDALGDLFDFYLEAPSLLGGGFDRAEALALRIEALDPPEGHFDAARLAYKRKKVGEAEREYRISVKLGPGAVGHAIGLARFLAQQGRLQECDAVLAQAETIAPGSPRLLYARASIYVETHRKPDDARRLLKTYLEAALTPDDPPREAAAKLLQRVSGT